MTDADNRLSAIDLTVPGGRFVIASSDSGQISPSANALLSQIPIPYVMSKDEGGDLRPSLDVRPEPEIQLQELRRYAGARG
jgi:hypothetical protein